MYELIERNIYLTPYLLVKYHVLQEGLTMIYFGPATLLFFYDGRYGFHFI